MSSIDDIIAKAVLPEKKVRIPIGVGALADEHDDLDAQLKALKDWEPAHLAEADPRVAIAERILDLEAEMSASEVEFRFRALGRPKYRALRDAHPGTAEQRFNPDTFPEALIAACSVEPKMSEADVAALFDVITDGSVEILFMAAYSINEGLSRVPFSKAASAAIERVETKS